MEKWLFDAIYLIIFSSKKEGFIDEVVEISNVFIVVHKWINQKTNKELGKAEATVDCQILYAMKAIFNIINNTSMFLNNEVEI